MFYNFLLKANYILYLSFVSEKTPSVREGGDESEPY